VVATEIDWDPAKADANRRKHGVRFEEAETALRDPMLVTIPDPDHSEQEDRFVAIGESRWEPRVLVIIFTIRNDRARLISARPATPAERRRFMSENRLREKPDESVEMRAEYDFSNGVRGRHYFPMTATRVSIEDDVARYFHDDASVNTALRMLIAEGRVPKSR
jgi:uncharacterized protein